MKKLSLKMVVLLLIAGGCYKNEDNTPSEPTIIIEKTEVFIETAISGSVIDSEEVILTDYYLQINDEIKNVESKDYFLFNLKNARKNGQTIHVVKDGNTVGIKTDLLKENDINLVQIQTHDPFIESTLPENNKLQLRSNITADFTGVTTEEGYTGELNVEHIDIHSSIALTTVGFDRFSDLLSIQTLGGFHLTVHSNSGERLTIDQNNPITLEIGKLENKENSLFMFDENDENWILIADIKEGDKVEAFATGYYALAKYNSGVFVEGRITKEDKYVAYHPMNWNVNGLTNDLFGTERGNWIACLPENKEVMINLINPCDEAIQSEMISINTQDVANQNIEIIDSENYQYFNSQVIDCNGNQIEDPSINIVSNGNTTLYQFSENNQDRYVAVCDEFSITAVDPESNSSGPTLNWSVDNTDDLGLLTDCSSLVDGFTRIRIRGEERIYSAFSLSENNDRSILTAPDQTVKLIFKETTPGSYDEKDINIVIDDESFGSGGYRILCENSMEGCGISNFNVTHLDEMNNGQLRVVFSGELWMQTINPPVAGNFFVEGFIITKL